MREPKGCIYPFAGQSRTVVLLDEGKAELQKDEIQYSVSAAIQISLAISTAQYFGLSCSSASWKMHRTI